MIAVNTNVLLRGLLDDDVTQSPKALRLFERVDDVLITDVVLAETVWVLTETRYRATRQDIVEVIMGLLEEPRVLFENRQVIWAALNEYADANPVRKSGGVREFGFVDSLIVNKAKAVTKHVGANYRGTFTFDEAAVGIRGTKAA